MRVIIQRVKTANVSINGKLISQINKGFLVFLGISKDDNEQKINYLANKVVNLRIMADSDDKMNLSLKDVKGEILIVSQFTLYGDCQKGNRPSFIKAAEPQKAEKFYQLFIQKCKESNLKVKNGVFGAKMSIKLINDGPVTLIIDN